MPVVATATVVVALALSFATRNRVARGKLRFAAVVAAVGLALAGAMRDLIENAERRERFGRAASAKARSFAAGAVIPRFEQAYRDVLAAG